MLSYFITRFMVMMLLTFISAPSLHHISITSKGQGWYELQSVRYGRALLIFVPITGLLRYLRATGGFADHDHINTQYGDRGLCC